MSRSPDSIPRPAAPERVRAPKATIPQTLAERQRALQCIRNLMEEQKAVPPLPLEEIQRLAGRVVETLGCDPAYRDYFAILVNNELWREAFAAVPFERRLLLLPKCLRTEADCRAEFDAFGLLCKRCGRCSIQDLQAEAERLGYAVLVAEGSAVVMALIQAKKVEAILGVSCLNVLERAFPNMEAAAIPGVAIPLLQDDCRETSVDLDWIRDYLHFSTDDQTRRLDLDALRTEVGTWFSPASLNTLMGTPDGRTEEIAREWLIRAGKRWRPFLVAAVYEALRDAIGSTFPDDLKQAALAVECFHKASLIHDDIEDGDLERYGAPTLSAQHGVAVALNVGDLLIGEGYRLIAATHFSAEQKAAMIRFAAEGQRQLCRGQGEELCWMQAPQPLTKRRVLAIFRQKTAPAFEVALHLGALAAGCEIHVAIAPALTAYSEALGVAYQIRDDIEDAGADAAGARPSLLPTLSEGEARRLLESYKNAAIQSLSSIANPNLKGLLRRVIGKIFNETEFNTWCREIQEQEQPS